MLEFVLSSDHHLEGLDKHYDDATERTLREMQKLYDYCYTHGITHLFLAGDITDRSAMSYETYISLYLFFLKNNGINTYYLAGNHDFEHFGKTSVNFLSVLSDKGALPNLKVFLEPKRQVIDGVPVNFLPYPSMQTLSKAKGGLNIAHVEYTGALGDNGRKLTTKNELATSPLDYTLSGHLHTYQLLESRRVLYCGSLFQKNFGENLPKGFVHGQATIKNGKVSVKHRFVENHPCMILENVHITCVDDYKQLKHSDNVRYKLHVGEDVPVPSTLMLDYPNITGGIHHIGHKKADVDVESVKIQTVNITTGLKEHLASLGLDTSDIKKAIKYVKDLRNQHGL